MLAQTNIMIRLKNNIANFTQNIEQIFNFCIDKTYLKR